MNAALFEQVAKAMPQTEDLAQKQINNGRFTIGICFLKTLCDEQMMDKRMIEPFMKSDDVESLCRWLASYEAEDIHDDADIPDKLTEGHAVIVAGHRLMSMQLMKPLNSRPNEIADREYGARPSEGVLGRLDDQYSHYPVTLCPADTGTGVLYGRIAVEDEGHVSVR